MTSGQANGVSKKGSLKSCPLCNASVGAATVPHQHLLSTFSRHIPITLGRGVGWTEGGCREEGRRRKKGGKRRKEGEIEGERERERAKGGMKEGRSEEGERRVEGERRDGGRGREEGGGRERRGMEGGEME